MIRFNVPPYTGREIENMKKAVENMHICGDGEFTKKCSEYLEKITGTAKCLLTTSCTHALEMAALLCDLKEGDEVTLYPGEKPGKVRNIQVHSQSVDTAYAGQRVAVNFSNLKKSDIQRGDVVAPPGSKAGYHEH